VRVIALANGLGETVDATVIALAAGKVVVMPMDTSYGIAADATNKEAVNRVFRLKGRQESQPLSVIVADLDRAMEWAHFALDAEEHLLWTGFMPGPLTIVLPLRQPLAYLEKDGGFRQPDHPLTQRVAEQFGKPYTATSANRSGSPPAYAVAEFLAQLPDDGPQPDLVIDGGRITPGPSSTVVSVVDRLKILREGAIPTADILALFR